MNKKIQCGGISPPNVKTKNINKKHKIKCKRIEVSSPDELNPTPISNSRPRVQ